MANFKNETLEAITESGHTITDVTFVGTSDGKLGMDIVQFLNESDFNYDSGYGSQEVDPSIIIQFSDNSYLERREYDGSEWWEHVKPYKAYTDYAPCNLVKTTKYSWSEYTLIEKSAITES